MGTNIKDFFWSVFHGLLKSTEFLVKEIILNLTQLLIITILHWLRKISSPIKMSQSIRKRLRSNLRHRTYFNSNRILTVFPFLKNQLRKKLGSTNPWLNCSAKEPLPIRRHRFSLCYAPTTTRILIPNRSTTARTIASTLKGRLPTTIFRCLQYRQPT